MGFVVVWCCGGVGGWVDLDCDADVDDVLLWMMVRL